MNKKLIYFDNASTTRVDDRVLEAMLPYFYEQYGNPSSSSNIMGAIANTAVENSTRTIKELLNADSINDIIYTSGATESNATIILGVARENCHIIVSEIEHPSILEPCKYLGGEVKISYVPVDREGRVVVSELEKLIRPNTILISIMGANNEIGTIQPIEEISAIAHEHNLLFHSDVTQLIGNQRIDLKKWKHVDAITLSAHKIYGPKGIGLLVINNRARSRIKPIMVGGGQQRGYRGGTLNVPGIVGMTRALKILYDLGADYYEKNMMLRELLIDRMRECMSIRVNGSTKDYLSNIVNVTFKDISALELAARLPDVVFSQRSACGANHNSSYVLDAVGITPEEQKNTVRFSFGRYNSVDEVVDITDRMSRIITDGK